MKRRVAKALRRCADRIDPPAPRVGNYRMNINVGTKDLLRQMQQEIQRQATLRVG